MPTDNASTADRPSGLTEHDLRGILGEIEAAAVRGPKLADVFERHAAPEYVFTSPAGVVSDREEILRGLRERTVAFKSYNMRDIDIRRYDSVAVAVGRAEGEGINPGGEIFRGAYRFTSVWNATPSGWKLVAWQATAIA